jgi:hypothetical protein
LTANMQSQQPWRKSEHYLGGSEGVAAAAVAAAVAAAPRNEALEAVAAAATTTTGLRKQKLSQMCDARGGCFLDGPETVSPLWIGSGWNWALSPLSPLSPHLHF